MRSTLCNGHNTFYVSKESPGLPWWSSGQEFACQPGTWVRSLVREDPTCYRTAKPVCHNHWSSSAHSFKRGPVLKSFFFKFYFIFKLYNIVLVLPNIEMNPPQVYMCSPSWSLLPPPSPYHPSGSSQCTSPKHPVSCINLGCNISILNIVICFVLWLWSNELIVL